MSDVIERIRVVDPAYRIEEPSGAGRPTIATLRLVDFRMVPENKPKDLEFYFSGTNSTVDLTEYENGIDDLLKLISTGAIKFPDMIKMGKPYETPLSLNNNKYCYVIYVLCKKNWQFSHKSPPFSIGEADLTPKIYSEARRVGPDGVAEQVKKDTPEKMDCRIAYFISDGKQAVIDNPRQYVHALNIHVDFTFVNSQGFKSLMPVIIDPDVRHPGGSEP